MGKPDINTIIIWCVVAFAGILLACLGGKS